MSAPDIAAQAIATAAEVAGLQALVRRCPTAADRKGLIMAAFCHGAITAEACQPLIEAHGLETA